MVRTTWPVPIQVIKREFGHVKGRFRGLTKQATLLALSNLWMVQKHLLVAGEVRPQDGDTPARLPLKSKAKHRLGLAMVRDEPYQIIDTGMRMLEPPTSHTPLKASPADG